MFEMDSRFDILIGDSIEKLKELEDESVYTCVTSPPYYALRDYDNADQIGLEETPEQYISKLVELFREVKRVLKPDGTLWINIGDTYASRKGHNDIKSKDLMGIPWMLAFALRTDGWYLRQDIIWSKNNPIPEPVKDRCVKSHEYIFLLSKSPNYYFDWEVIQEDSITESKTNKSVSADCGLVSAKPSKGSKYSSLNEEKSYRQGMHKNRGNGLIEKRLNLPNKDTFISFIREHSRIDDIVKCGVTRTTVEHWRRSDDYFAFPTTEDWERCSHLFKDCKGFEEINKGLTDVTFETDAIGKFNDGRRRKRDVWKVNVNNYKGAHFATYPEELITPCVLAGCPKGEIVLDPFSGSGTTGVASVRNGRKYIGIELNPDYAELSINRLKTEFRRKSLW